jgi:hypothetical protein
VGHGIFGIIGKEGWRPYYDVFGIAHALFRAYQWIIGLYLVDNLYLVFANGLRAAYVKLPSTGIPRILRLNKKSGTVRGFSVVDPGGNWLRVSGLGETEEGAGEARTTGLVRVIENAARLGDAKGDDSAAAGILDRGWLASSMRQLWSEPWRSSSGPSWPCEYGVRFEATPDGVTVAWDTWVDSCSAHTKGAYRGSRRRPACHCRRSRHRQDDLGRLGRCARRL